MKIYPLLLISIALGLLPACSNQELTPDEPSEAMEMKVNLFLQEEDNLIPLNQTDDAHASTRGADNDLSAGFHLYGFFSNADMPTELNTSNNTASEAPTRYFFDNTPITKEGKYPDSEPRRYWAGNGTTRHSFFAYSGPTGAATGKPNILTSKGGLTTTNYFPYITFFQPANPVEQYDFLVAYGPTNLIVHQTAPSINIYLRHACARVVFRVMTMGGSSLYYTTATATYTDAVKSKGDLYYKPQERPNSSYTDKYAINTSFQLNEEELLIPSSASSEGKSVLLGDMKLVPQTLPGGWLMLELAYRLSDTSPTVTKNKAKIPPLTIEPDKQYTFYLSISDQNPELKVSNIIIEPWKTEKYLVDPLN